MVSILHDIAEPPRRQRRRNDILTAVRCAAGERTRDLGRGLPLALEILIDHNGAQRLKDAPSPGTRFSLSLPRLPRHLASRPEDAASAKAPCPPCRLPLGYRRDVCRLQPKPSSAKTPNAMEIVVSISDMKVTNRSHDVLVTHALGSCLGLAAYDPAAGVAGLIHCLLPLARDTPKSAQNPFMYVNTGIPQMMRSMFSRGATRENLILKAAGCGRMMHISNQFDTGANNLAALRKLLAVNEMRLAAEDVGGTIPRTMRLYADTGRLVISSCGRTWEL